MNKPLEPLTSRQIVMIVGNIRKVMSTRNSRNLTKQAYNFLYQASGFIAHYNLYGFQATYEDETELATDIIKNKRYNQWTNFQPGDKDYDYYMSKKSCYNAICEMLVEFGYEVPRESAWGW